MCQGEERKKENKIKISCLLVSAFTWASRTLGAFLNRRTAKGFCLYAVCLTLLWLSQSCSHTLRTSCHTESAPSVNLKCYHTFIHRGGFRQWHRGTHPLLKSASFLSPSIIHVLSQNLTCHAYTYTL